MTDTIDTSATETTEVTAPEVRPGDRAIHRTYSENNYTVREIVSADSDSVLAHYVNTSDTRDAPHVYSAYTFLSSDYRFERDVPTSFVGAVPFDSLQPGDILHWHESFGAVESLRSPIQIGDHASVVNHGYGDRWSPVGAEGYDNYVVSRHAYDAAASHILVERDGTIVNWPCEPTAGESPESRELSQRVEHLTSEVAELRSQLAAATAQRDTALTNLARAERDIEYIGDELISEATDRDWCSDFERFVDRVNPELSHGQLKRRENDYCVTFTVNVSVSARDYASAEESARDVLRSDPSHYIGAASVDVEEE